MCGIAPDLGWASAGWRSGEAGLRAGGGASAGAKERPRLRFNAKRGLNMDEDGGESACRSAGSGPSQARVECSHFRFRSSAGFLTSLHVPRAFYTQHCLQLLAIRQPGLARFRKHLPLAVFGFVHVAETRTAPHRQSYRVLREPRPPRKHSVRVQLSRNTERSASYAHLEPVSPFLPRPQSAHHRAHRPLTAHTAFKLASAASERKTPAVIPSSYAAYADRSVLSPICLSAPRAAAFFPR